MPSLDSFRSDRCRVLAAHLPAPLALWASRVLEQSVISRLDSSDLCNAAPVAFLHQAHPYVPTGTGEL